MDRVDNRQQAGMSVDPIVKQGGNAGFSVDPIVNRAGNSVDPILNQTGGAASSDVINKGSGGTAQTTRPGTTATPTKATTPAPTATTPTAQPVVPFSGNASIVPGAAVGNGQINVVDAASQIVSDPGLLLKNNMQLSNRVPTATQAEIDAGLVKTDTNVDPSALNQTAATATAATAAETDAKDAQGYDVAKTAQQVAAADMKAAKGVLSDGAKVTASQIDMNATANGTNAVGKALNAYAKQDISNIIDTSTAAGKLLAQQLGEGGYTDSKATVKGQLEVLASEFVDANGDPKIPSWASATARNVSRIAAFKGMTGTAATAAMSQALLEASLPIAQQDAQFFQTLTVKNLDNRQQATINKANVLANFELANLDARMTAAVETSKNFMQMDLANLSNEQQARVINHEARVQSILEDAKAVNTERMFLSQSQNEKDMFYDNLNASLKQFNAAQTNAMAQFNTSEINGMSQFNANLENNREQFYKNMQFNVDVSNAKWRQEITMKGLDQKFEAAATDVKNLVGISVEQLNQLWDRSDALLDYVWKTADNEAERKNKLAQIQLQGSLSAAESEAEGWGSILGTIAGAGASALFGWLF